MLIDGTVHLKGKLSNKEKVDLSESRLINMMLFKEHKINFKFIEPEIDKVFEMEDVYYQNYDETAVDHMAGDVRKLIIYHTKNRFATILDRVEKFVVYLEGKTITFT